MANYVGRATLRVLITAAISLLPFGVAGAEQKVTPPPFYWPTPQPTPVPVVRVRNPQANQCLFIGAQGWDVHTWGCWNDPNMRFSLETLPDGRKRLRHLRTNLCIHRANPNSTLVFGAPCGLNDMNLTLVPQGAGTVQISLPQPMNEFSGASSARCLRSGASNGALTTTSWCFPDPAQQFILDPA